MQSSSGYHDRRKQSNHLAKLFGRNDQQEAHGSSCSVELSTSIWHGRLGHPNAAGQEASKRNEETGIKYSGKEEKCETCFLKRASIYLTLRGQNTI